MSRLGFGGLASASAGALLALTAGGLALSGIAACGGGSGGGGQSTTTTGSGGAIGSTTTSSVDTASTSATVSTSATTTTSSTTSSSTTSSSATGPGHCVPGCVTAADCCPAGLPNCPSTSYPTNYACDNGTCKAPQCAAQADCTKAGLPSTYDCVSYNGAMVCKQLCAVDSECTAPTKCLDPGGGAAKYCALPAAVCTTDAECGTAGACKSGACVCTGDAACAGFGKCDVASGTCFCNTDVDCTALHAKHCAH